MKKAVIAADSFKGSLGSEEVARNIAAGIAAVYPQCDIHCVAVADGGEGTASAIVAATGGRMISAEVTDPLGRPVTASYGIVDGHIAVVDTAAASGLTLLHPSERNPMLATTRGTGELIRCAIDAGCDRIIIGAGGSATVDGGMGMLEALGFAFLAADGQRLAGCGANLGRVAAIDASKVTEAVRHTRFEVACDVRSPLCGDSGAARTFARQKGAAPEQIELLERGLNSYAAAIFRHCGIDIRRMEGAGAAGGLGGGAAALLGAEIRSCIDAVLEAVGFADLAADADIIITGEGRMDAQTAMGKVPSGVLAAARGVPVVALCGCVAEDADTGGYAAVLPIHSYPCTEQEAMQPDRTAADLRRTAELAARLICIGERQSAEITDKH